MSTAEEKFDDLGPIAGDLNAIKDQMDHLKDFKNEVGRRSIFIWAVHGVLFVQARGPSFVFSLYFARPVCPYPRQFPVGGCYVLFG